MSWLINHIHFSFFFLAETDGRRRIWFYHSGNGGGGWVMGGCHGCSLKGEEEWPMRVSWLPRARA